jgi:hypothetical protein
MLMGRMPPDGQRFKHEAIRWRGSLCCGSTRWQHVVRGEGSVCHFTTPFLRAIDGVVVAVSLTAFERW